MTKIEWVINPDGTRGETWNVVTGCSHAGSPGCDHCYARRMARRLAGRHGYPPAPRHFDVTPRPDRLGQPLRWKKPRTVFVVSMGDLFHASVPDEFIDDVFGVILMTPQHSYQLLTKRPARMLMYLTTAFRRRMVYETMRSLFRHLPGDYSWPVNYGDVIWPLQNAWYGVTVENQETANLRRADFEVVPAAVKFVSYEPALGPVDWTGWEFVDQIISGGETGPGARPSHSDWHRTARDFCQINGIAYFMKQWGEWEHSSQCVGSHTRNAMLDGWTHYWDDDTFSVRIGKKRAGRLLDGRTWDEMPG